MSFQDKMNQAKAKARKSAQAPSRLPVYPEDKETLWAYAAHFLAKSGWESKDTINTGEVFRIQCKSRSANGGIIVGYDSSQGLNVTPGKVSLEGVKLSKEDYANGAILLAEFEAGQEDKESVEVGSVLAEAEATL